MIDRSDPHWYRDAVIYQVHVKSFFDASNDGIGDFAGLMEKLDYIGSLGVTAIWMLPFYPSPLRDDGYDIADYRRINPAYGSMRDFRRLVRACHERGIRVITELVINHTSDQHPWFQRARAAKPGSRYRDWYVWSDDDKKFADARIIFLDTETSNWSWDPVARAYYWHRFYSHQPDLNFDNPRVLEAVIDVMRFWLDMGVDGLRLDAIPYLIERDGTNCENLAETHDVIRKIRAALDAEYPDRMLLAEANQWPEDTARYFGDADECHLSFHFPLMPRMYMAIAQEDRHPVTDIMRQTPDIPEGCQWAIFLRNHDELTLEMVTDRERDYLWRFYAADRRMRINLGIRRRLAPLLDNDRRKIELMNSLLLSMPGTPILYYGDEIGMGDNIYLGDRDGVRTPMQWSLDRNAGFSRADPARLFLPPVMDPIYGFNAVNVEAQARSATSLLNWVRSIVAVRQRYQAFGRGGLRFLFPGNRRVLAYLREFESDTILCVANLSRSPQAVELDLAEFAGRVPVEMLAGTPFPPIGELTYLLTLPAYGFFWFLLGDEAQMPSWHAPLPPAMPELVTLVMQRDPQDVLSGREANAFGRQVAPAYLMRQRWFDAKDRRIDEVRVEGAGTLADADGQIRFMLARLAVRLGGDDGIRRYFLPLAINWDGGEQADGTPSPFTLARVRRAARPGLLLDASEAPQFGRAVVQAIREDRDVTAQDGIVRFRHTGLLAEAPEASTDQVRRLGVEQSNTSIVIDDTMILKLYRRLSSGLHPEIEVGRFLADVAGYRNVPPLYGSVELVDGDGTPTALGVLQGFVRSQGDGWSFTLDFLARQLDELRLLEAEEPEEEAERNAIYLLYVEALGRRTAELHRAFATPTDDDAFRAEPLGGAELAAWRDGLVRQGEQALQALEQAVAGGGLPERPAAQAARLLARRAELLDLLPSLADLPEGAMLTRVHGDYHLGQVLVAKDDVYLIDFEGEPARSAEERRRKTSPMKDVAGMLRSFDYAAEAAMRQLEGRFPEQRERLEPTMQHWRQAVDATFMDSYRATIGDCPSWPADADTERRMLRLFLLEKALYEVAYEAANRPDWIDIPVGGVLRLLDAIATGESGDG